MFKVYRFLQGWVTEHSQSLSRFPSVSKNLLRSQWFSSFVRDVVWSSTQLTDSVLDFPAFLECFLGSCVSRRVASVLRDFPVFLDISGFLSECLVSFEIFRCSLRLSGFLKDFRFSLGFSSFLWDFPVFFEMFWCSLRFPAFLWDVVPFFEIFRFSLRFSGVLRGCPLF